MKPLQTIAGTKFSKFDFNQFDKVRDGLALIKNWLERWTHVPLTGLDWGSSYLKVVQLGWVDGQIVLHKVFIRNIEKESAVLIKQELAQNQIAVDQVAAGLSSPEVIARIFQFPPMPRKELHHAIQLEAEQVVLNGHSLREMTLDWHPLANSNGTTRGLLTVAPREILAARLKKLKEAGITPRIMDVEGLALWNAYWNLIGKNQNSNQTVLLANVGARTTNLVIGKGRDELLMMRDFQSPRAESIEEFGDSISYARSKAGLRQLDRIYLTGGASNPQLGEQLSTLTDTPVSLWNPLDQVGCCPGSIENSAGPLLTVAIGLALRHAG